MAADCENVTRIATAGPGASADDGRPPQLEVGAPTLQRLGRSRKVRVYATSSERGAMSASGALEVAGLALPVKTIDRRRVRVGGGGVVLTYRLAGRHLREALRGPAPRQARGRAPGRGGHRPGRRVEQARRAADHARAGRRARRRARARALHPEPGDMDGDEVPDGSTTARTTKNGSQLDTDGDGAGDACDDDDDDDGVPDATDNCRLDRNPGQEDDDGDGYGNVCPPTHSDSDGIIDDDDNCDTVPNPDQSDLDGDEHGDVCDNDDDGDDFDDGFDNCPTVYNLDRGVDRNGDGFVNHQDQEDHDGDGIGTACDPDEALVGGPGGSTDTTRPRLAVSVERRLRLAAARAGLVVRVRCSEACGTTAELAVPRSRRPSPRPAPHAHPGRRLGAPPGRRHHLRLRALRPARAKQPVPDGPAALHADRDGRGREWQPEACDPAHRPGSLRRPRQLCILVADGRRLPRRGGLATHFLVTTA